MLKCLNCAAHRRRAEKNESPPSMRGFFLSHFFWCLAPCAFFAASATASILPADRTCKWEGNVGVPGGIPRRTAIYKNMITAGARNNGSADCTAILQNAVNSCPANQVIYFPPGTYRVDGVITNQFRSKITIRGAGMGKTRLLLNSGGTNGAFHIGSSDWPKPEAGLIVTGGATAGSKTVNVLTTAAIAVGKLIRIEQADPTWVRQVYGDNNNMGFLCKVTSKTANSVTFSPPLPFTLNNSPRLAVYPTTPIEGVGIEDLTLDLSNSAAFSAIFMEQAYGCWVKGVEVYHASSRQIWLVWALNCEIRECYTHHARGGGPNHEGIDLYENACWNLVENNISVRGGFPMIILGDWKGGCSGNVVAYNYCYNVDTGSDIAGADISVNHGPHNMMNLVEGNAASFFISDGYFGSSSHNTVFRNAFSATHPTLNGNLKAIGLNRWSTYFNVVGNVLGHPAFLAKGGLYETQTVDHNYTIPLIYQLGFPNMGNNSYSGVLPATNPPNYTVSNDISKLDLNVRNTLLRHGNYDYATRSLKWDPTNPDHVLPNSYYRSSKPSWFGNKAWPPVDPARPALAVPASIPAGDRYLNSTLPVLNISTRASIQNGERVLIGGFLITGAGQKNLLLRALGPSLPLSPALSDPVIELRDARGALITSNDNWRSSQQTAIIGTGLQPRNDKEAALLVTLNPGHYTAIVRGANGVTGIGLIEGYDLDAAGSTTKLTNISTRGNVLSGNGVLIGGFILGNGSWTAPIVVRAIGPSLARAGIQAPLADPVLELHDRYGALIARNDNWRDTDANEVQLSRLAPTDARESAIVMRLAPGNYTAIVSGKNGSSGVGLVEVYNQR